MAWTPSPKHGKKAGLSRYLPTSVVQLALCLAALLIVVMVIVMGGSAFFALSPPASESGSTCSSKSLSLDLFRRFTPVRKLKPADTFGTIFHLELSMFYNAHSEQRDTAKLISTLRSMQAAGFKTVVFSASWEWLEPEDSRLRYEYLTWLMEAACRNTALKVDMILDMLHAPKWVWDRYPDAIVVDSDRRNYTQLSWFHPLSNEAALRLMGMVASHLHQHYPTCAMAIQPVFNNEYEAKYTQEFDAFQDYSKYALVRFRDWLRVRSPSLLFFNTRWSTAFKTWDEVVPPKLKSGDLMGVDFSARYWDFLKFREDYGANLYNRACSMVKRSGLKCFHHFPEFFSVLDAIYGASMFKRIAASPYTDFVIMDSNFRTPYGTMMNTHKLRIYVAAARSYGKPVYFEAAVERFAGLDVLEAGFRNSLLAGGDNLGITNWHTRVEMNQSLANAMRPALPCKPCELVGVFLHLDSCSAFHGVQWHWVRKDPLHDFVEDLAEKLASNCGTDIAVYIELDRFLVDIRKFTRVVFVEPLVLYDSAELASYVAVKAALKGVPHVIHHLPMNTTSGPSLVVFQDMPGLPPVHGSTWNATTYL